MFTDEELKELVSRAYTIVSNAVGYDPEYAKQGGIIGFVFHVLVEQEKEKKAKP